MKIHEIVFFLMLICTSTPGLSQTEVKAYYFDLNKSEGAVYDIRDARLDIQYFDKVGESNSITLDIFNAKKELQKSISLAKHYGLNQYSVSIPDLFANMPVGESYTCQLKDETGKVHKLILRKSEHAEIKDPELDIIVKPVAVNCESANGNLTDIYAKVISGRGPYTLNWFVMDQHQKHLLYQPSQQVLEDAGKSSAVGLDLVPPYSVMVNVKDACGGEASRVIEVRCGDTPEQINTIFIEKIDQSTPGSKGN